MSRDHGLARAHHIDGQGRNQYERLRGVTEASAQAQNGGDSEGHHRHAQGIEGCQPGVVDPAQAQYKREQRRRPAEQHENADQDPARPCGPPHDEVEAVGRRDNQR